MEKINIAELLKDCPKGMELDCVMYENVYFDKVSDDKKAYYPILCYKTDEKGNRSSISFTKNGCESMLYGAKCVIFPKGKTTWEGFQRPFKDGDIVATNSGRWIGLTTSGECGRLIPTYCVIKTYGEFEAYLDRKESWLFNRLATEEEKQKLFQAIKDNGYKWNAETKTLEKLIEPKFKVGDKVVKKDNPTECWYVQGVDTNCNLDYFYYIVAKGKIANLHFKEQDDWELVSNKFDINTLKPFESRVLVRSSYGDIWRPAIYGVFDSKKHYHYVVGGSYWTQCIPFEGNEHLLGKTDDCDEFYKTWE